MKDALARNEDAGLPTAPFSDVKGNPVAANVDAGVTAYRAAGCDGIIAFAGGSGLDATKAVGGVRRWLCGCPPCWRGRRCLPALLSSSLSKYECYAAFLQSDRKQAATLSSSAQCRRCAHAHRMSPSGPGCVKTIFWRFKRNIHPFIEFLQSIKSMAYKIAPLGNWTNLP